MRHHVNEDWAVCQVPAFVSRLAFLSAGSPLHYTSKNARSTQQCSPLAQAALPSRFYRGNLDTVWGCQSRLIQPSEPVLHLPALLHMTSWLLWASLQTVPHCKKDPSQQSFFSQKSITSDAAASCWLASASLLAPSICKVDITHTRPIPAWEKWLKRRETLRKGIYSLFITTQRMEQSNYNLPPFGAETKQHRMVRSIDVGFCTVQILLVCC